MTPYEQGKHDALNELIKILRELPATRSNENSYLQLEVIFAVIHTLKAKPVTT